MEVYSLAQRDLDQTMQTLELGVYSLVVHSLGVYSLAQRDLDQTMQSLAIEVYSLGIYSLVQRDVGPDHAVTKTWRLQSGSLQSGSLQ